ncbi:MAG TPA: hypothetical protein VFS76_25840 [Pyrinomonadaceae bacterium]|nr:hypothetical protein [Pyrinomonadaceae bacterium]
MLNFLDVLNFLAVARPDNSTIESRVGLDVIAKADTFLPTATQTNETREKTVLVIETKLLLVITRVVQIMAGRSPSPVRHAHHHQRESWR